MKYTSTYLLLILLLTLHNGYAQTPEQAVENLRKNYSKEGIYIHYDKSSYVAGEAIWFKVYVIDRVSPSFSSTAVNIELLDDSGKVAGSKILSLTSGAAAGNFDLPRNARQSFYTVRAHTRQMMNFGNTYFYDQPLKVYNPSSANDKIKPAATPRIYFLPEGGEMVYGISNTVAFKCTDQFGAPLTCSGIITDSRNMQVATFTSVHDGMGKFSFVPKTGEIYNAMYTADNQKLVAILPQIKNEGISLQIQQSGKEKFFMINSEKAVSGVLEPAYLLAVMENNVLLKQELPASSKNIRGRLPLENIPSGILQLTVFNKNDQPLAERMLFVNHDDFLVNASLHTDTISIRSRGKNVYSLFINDTTPGNYSVSVTDAQQDIASSNRENIVSRLLFTNEIKDRINDPLYYFESKDPARNDHLDLVMLTSGWRKFTWQQVLSKGLPAISYRDADYVSFAAKIYKAGTNIPLPNTGLTLLIETEESFDAVKFITDKDANLIVPGMLFSDSAVITSINNTSPKTRVALSVYSLPISKLLAYSPKATDDNSFFAPGESGSNLLVSSRYLTSLDKGSRNFISLQDVQVSAVKKSPVKQQARSRYMNSAFTSRDRNNNLSPDAYWNYARENMLMRSGRNYFRGTWIYDGITQSDRFLNSLNAQLGFAGNGDYMGYYPAPFPQLSSYNGDHYARSIIDNYDNKVVLEGFSPVREFFSPDYSVTPTVDFIDNRSTLYWNPYLTSKKGAQKIPISFYNSDNGKKFRVVITGMTTEGKFLYIDQVIE